jgi:hypothetical protein
MGNKGIPLGGTPSQNPRSQIAVPSSLYFCFPPPLPFDHILSQKFPICSPSNSPLYFEVLSFSQPAAIFQKVLPVRCVTDLSKKHNHALLLGETPNRLTYMYWVLLMVGKRVGSGVGGSRRSSRLPVHREFPHTQVPSFSSCTYDRQHPPPPAYSPTSLGVKGLRVRFQFSPLRIFLRIPDNINNRY